MEEKETGRLEGFSDGVIAVAITLLVLSLQGPPKILSDTDLLSWLGHQLPNYLAFVTSFATIGVMWMNHHRMFSYIRRIDATLMLLNLLLLLFIVFIPFPTDLVAQYLFSPNHLYAALLFNGTYVVLAICFNVLFLYAVRENRLLGKHVNQHEVEAMKRQYRYGPLIYLITFGVTWISVPASLIMNLLLAVFFAIPARKQRSRSRPDASASLDPEGITTPEQDTTSLIEEQR